MANRIKLAGTTANSFQIGLQGVTINAAPATSAYQLNLPANVGTNNQYLRTDGTGNLSWATVSGGTGSPGGSNTQIQFNDDGSFGGSAAFTFNKTTNAVAITGNASVGNLTTTGILSATGNISANYFIGNGALLTGIATGTPSNIANGTSNISIPTANGNIVMNSNATLVLTLSPNVALFGTGSGGSLSNINNINANGIVVNANANASIFYANAGNVTNPSISFQPDTNTGIYRIGDDQIGITTGGSQRANISNTGINITGIVSATGNITAPFFFGNGSALTGVSLSSLSNGNSNIIIANSGANAVFNIRGVTNVMTVANTSVITGTGSGGNITGANVITANTISVTGNIGNANVITANTLVYNRTYGAFYSNATQSSNGANTTNYFTFNNTDIANSVSIASSSQITIARTGNYNIQFSAVMQHTVNQTADVEIWLTKNGTAVPWTNTVISVPKDYKYLAAWNWLVTAANVNDYFQIAWASADTSVSAIAIDPANTIANVGVPSIISTVTPVGA